MIACRSPSESAAALDLGVVAERVLHVVALRGVVEGHLRLRVLLADHGDRDAVVGAVAVRRPEVGVQVDVGATCARARPTTGRAPGSFETSACHQLSAGNSEQRVPEIGFATSGRTAAAGAAAPSRPAPARRRERGGGSWVVVRHDLAVLVALVHSDLDWGCRTSPVCCRRRRPGCRSPLSRRRGGPPRSRRTRPGLAVPPGPGVHSAHREAVRAQRVHRDQRRALAGPLCGRARPTGSCSWAFTNVPELLRRPGQPVRPQRQGRLGLGAVVLDQRAVPLWRLARCR